MKRFLYIIFLLSASVYSQEYTAGLIMPDIGHTLCCVFIPDSGLKVYDQPNGNSKGSIYLGEPDNHNEVYTAFIKVNGIVANLDHTNFEAVGYEIMALEFVAYSSGFVKLKNNYWINVEELIAKNMKLTSWVDYAVNKGTEWYASPPGLNLRTGPSTDFNKIVTLKGDVFGISLTGETKGKWSKVNVTHYKEHPCSGSDDLIIKTYSGWVKLISEEDTLNVWYYNKGC